MNPEVKLFRFGITYSFMFDHTIRRCMRDEKGMLVNDLCGSRADAKSCSPVPKRNRSDLDKDPLRGCLLTAADFDAVAAEVDRCIVNVDVNTRRVLFKEVITVDEKRQDQLVFCSSRN